MKMGLLEEMNQRVKKFGIIDVKLAQGAAMFGALIIAKLICAMKPACVFLLKE